MAEAIDNQHQEDWEAYLANVDIVGEQDTHANDDAGHLIHLEPCGHSNGHDINRKLAHAIRIIAINLASKAGSGNATHRGHLLREYMVRVGADLLLASETNLMTAAAIAAFVRGVEAGGAYGVVCAPTTNKSSGVAILWRKELGQMDQLFACEGRVCAVTIAVPQTTGPQVMVRVIAIYGPTGGTSAYRTPAQSACETDIVAVMMRELETARTLNMAVIVGGDMNSVDDPVLDAPGTGGVHREASVISSLLSIGLEDQFRMMHPDSVSVTKLGTRANTGSRLDVILTSAHITVIARAAGIHTTPQVDTNHLVPFLDVSTSHPTPLPDSEWDPPKDRNDWRKMVDKCHEILAQDEGDQILPRCIAEALTDPRKGMPDAEGSCTEFTAQLEAAIDANRRTHAMREYVGCAIDYLTRMVHTVTQSLTKSDGKSVGRPPLNTFLTGALTGVSNSIGVLRATMVATLGTHGSWRGEANDQRKTATIEAYSQLVADCKAAHKWMKDAGGDIQDAHSVAWTLRSRLNPPRIHRSHAEWQTAWEALEPYLADLSARVACATSRAWRMWRKEDKDNRLSLVDQGKTGELIKRIFRKPRGNSGYTPSPRLRDGHMWVPVDPQDIRREASEDFRKKFDRGNLQLPPFLSTQKDDAGTIRTDTNAPPPTADPGLVDLWDLIVWNNRHNPALQPHLWGDMNTRMSAEEERVLCHSPKPSKAPGKSTLKVWVTQFFPDWVRKLLHAIVNIMLVLGLIPESAKLIQICCIPKPAGGFRPLSLAEEVVKAAEGVLAKRLTTARHTLGEGTVLGAMNAAYDRGRAGTSYVLNINACVKEDSLETGSPVCLVIMDFMTFFDLAPREVGTACMRGRGVPDAAIRFVEEVYTKMHISVITNIGPAPATCRDGSLGVGQGLMLSAECPSMFRIPSSENWRAGNTCTRHREALGCQGHHTAMTKPFRWWPPQRGFKNSGISQATLWVQSEYRSR